MVAGVVVSTISVTAAGNVDGLPVACCRERHGSDDVSRQDHRDHPGNMNGSLIEIALNLQFSLIILKAAMRHIQC